MKWRLVSTVCSPMAQHLGPWVERPPNLLKAYWRNRTGVLTHGPNEKMCGIG